jgi:serine/threonine-protein kinase PknK
VVGCLVGAGETVRAARSLLPWARLCAHRSLIGLLRYGDPRVLTIVRRIAADSADDGSAGLPAAFVDAVLS